MRILQLPSWYLPEGGYFCQHQSQALLEAGNDVHILANVVLPWRKYKWSVLKYPLRSFYSVEEGILVYRYFSWKYPFLDEANIIKWARKTVNLFDKYKETHGLPDIIHAHSSMWGGYAAALIKEKYGVPYVITEHRGIFGQLSDYAKGLFKTKYIPYLQQAFSSADCIIPVSSQQVPKIREYCGNKIIPIKVIPNMLDTDFFHFVNRERAEKDIFTFVSVNGFYYLKGYDILLPAFDLVKAKLPSVRLRLVGENFEQKDFQDLLANSGNARDISFAGEVDREGVRKELWAADAFVIPSRVEAQSVATIEAMSTGLPVVGTEVTPREIATEECGYIVPIEDVQALANAMIRMVENRNSFNGRFISEHIKSLVSKKTVTEQILKVYKEVLKK